MTLRRQRHQNAEKIADSKDESFGSFFFRYVRIFHDKLLSLIATFRIMSLALGDKSKFTVNNSSSLQTHVT